MVCDRKHRGAYSELIACAFLLDQGYEVFRNVSAHGLGDLVAWKDGKFTVFDVKTVSAGGGGSAIRLLQAQIDAGIQRINVHDDGRCKIIREVVAKAPVDLICQGCGTGFRFRDSSKRFCSSKCSGKDKRERRRSIKRRALREEPA